MRYIVVSDFHLGKGRFLKNGQLNLLEDFLEDERFAEFCDYFSSSKNFLANIHLVLNGDILNLIQIDVDGIFSHLQDEEFCLRALESIIRGHPIFFESLRKFMATPNKKLTYVIGNHDAGLAFERVSQRLKDEVGGEINIVHHLEENGLHIEHGHRFEAVNSTPRDKFFVKGPRGREILNLPWGSLFCLNVLPSLKKERPHIDKVRPMGAYLKWCFLHDFTFFIRAFWVVFKYLRSTRTDTYTKHNRNFFTTFKILKQITIYPIYSRQARSILKRRPHLHTVVMGHTHLLEWRRFPEGKYYFNSGTWDEIPSVDLGLHSESKKLSYVELEVHIPTKTLRKGALNVWHGKWRPYRSEITTNL